MLWKVLKYSEETKLFLYYSFFMLKVSHSNEVSVSDFIKSYVLLSKALFLNSKFDEAVNLLRNLLDTFACIPIEDLKYLSEIYRLNNISLTNMFVNFDSSLKFFSKYHVYEKSKGIFVMLANLRKKNNYKEKVFFNKDYKTLLNEKTPDTNISEAMSYEMNHNNYHKSYISASKRTNSSNNTCIINSLKHENTNKLRKDHSYDNCLNVALTSKRKSDSTYNYGEDNNDLFKNSEEKLMIKKKEECDKDFKRKSRNNHNESSKRSLLSKNKNTNHESTPNTSEAEKEIKERNMKATSSILRNSLAQKDSKVLLNHLNDNSANSNQISNNAALKNIKDINCDDFTKLEKFIDDNLNKIEIPTDSPCKHVNKY